MRSKYENKPLAHIRLALEQNKNGKKLLTLQQACQMNLEIDDYQHKSDNYSTYRRLKSDLIVIRNKLVMESSRTLDKEI